jgi:hypothetical protein
MKNKKLIIKSLLLMNLLSLSLFATSLSHQEISKMVSKIQVERVGIDLATLENTPNPFAIIEEVIEEKPKEVKIDRPKMVKKVISHKLVAILNHAAFIAGKWYKIGDKIGIYTVTTIGKDRITIKNKNESKELIIEKKDKKFKMFKGN